MAADKVSSLYAALDTLHAHGWKSSDALIGDSEADANELNQGTVTKIVKNSSQMELRETLSLSKPGVSLDILVVNQPGRDKLSLIDVASLHLGQGDIPTLSSDELLVIFSQQKEYLHIPLPIGLPMFKDRSYPDEAQPLLTR